MTPNEKIIQEFREKFVKLNIVNHKGEIVGDYNKFFEAFLLSALNQRETEAKIQGAEELFKMVDKEFESFAITEAVAIVLTTLRAKYLKQGREK